MTTARGGQTLRGSVKWKYSKKYRKLCWCARFTLPNGKRSKWVALDPSILEHEIERAHATARDSAERVRATGGVSEGVKETTSEWFTRFHAHKEAKGLSTVGEMRSRYRLWIEPEIGSKEPCAVAREDLEAIVRRLDRAIESWTKHEGRRGQGRISPSTAANVWGDVTHAFDEMVNAKDPGLRALTVNPCANVRGPEAGDDRTGQILYADELVALLVGCAVDDDGKDVPLYRRIAYAMAHYTMTRASELEAITAADVDLVHDTIRIAVQVNRKSKGRKDTKRTKTKTIRTIDIEPHVRPLVEWLVQNPQGKGGRLVKLPPPEDRAELLRRDLWTVGQRRHALHHSNELEKWITLHDLRDSGLTHMAVRGDSPIAIQWRGGHTDFKTTQGYIERGKVEARRIGEPLPALPEGLIPTPTGSDIGSVISRTDAAKVPETIVFSATPTGIEPVLPT